MGVGRTCYLENRKTVLMSGGEQGWGSWRHGVFGGARESSTIGIIQFCLSLVHFVLFDFCYSFVVPCAEQECSLRENFTGERGGGEWGRGV